MADSLPWTCGSFLSAARGALGNGRVACSPSSGFHHAGYDSGYGYCTFNGLMVAALALKAEGKVQRVGILHCDQHYGDGTAEIIAALKIDWIRHVSREYASADEAGPFIDALPEVARSFADCDLLMYQAGADPHINDPRFTTAQLAERDRIVFSAAHSLGLPVVWNLAGGYQEPHSACWRFTGHGGGLRGANTFYGCGGRRGVGALNACYAAASAASAASACAQAKALAQAHGRPPQPAGHIDHFADEVQAGLLDLSSATTDRGYRRRRR